jgi:hypothetical protein
MQHPMLVQMRQALDKLVQEVLRRRLKPLNLLSIDWHSISACNISGRKNVASQLCCCTTSTRRSANLDQLLWQRVRRPLAIAIHVLFEVSAEELKHLEWMFVPCGNEWDLEYATQHALAKAISCKSHCAAQPGTPHQVQARLPILLSVLHIHEPA